MQFTLYYRGELKANARREAKHDLRKHFHRQLRNLWDVGPLQSFKVFLSDPPAPAKTNVLVKKHGFTFAPLVSERLALVAELDILILWPQAPGAIITSGGDVDNRLKTLLDSLKVPSEPTALRPGTAPGVDEVPFFCLLENDSLITRLAVETDRFLDPVASRSEVALFIRVATRRVNVTYDTIAFP